MMSGLSFCRIPDNEQIEHNMKIVYESLNEKDRRRYAAVEALKLGHGGQVYIAQVLDCDRNTIAKGIRALDEPIAARDC